MAGHFSLARTVVAFAVVAMALLVAAAITAWYLQVPLTAFSATPDAKAEKVAFSNEPISPLPQSVGLDAEKVALGAKLFHDARLSHDDSISCASCHLLDRGGVDGRRTAVGIGGKIGTINTPTVFNSAYNFRQFWDGRATSLEEQAVGPVHNPIEMASDWPEIIGKLSKDNYYRNAFVHLYGGSITGAAIIDAIATFERSLVTPDAPFDRWLRGDPAALTEPALRGYRLFKDLGCASCHQGMNVGGNFFAGLGIFGDFFGDRRKDAAEDQGRFNATGKETDRHRFKVPSLRNVALTAPYFHDGSVETLDEAVRIMAKYQLGRELSREEIGLVAEFLRSLTGTYKGQAL